MGRETKATYLSHGSQCSPGLGHGRCEHSVRGHTNLCRRHFPLSSLITCAHPLCQINRVWNNIWALSPSSHPLHWSLRNESSFQSWKYPKEIVQLVQLQASIYPWVNQLGPRMQAWVCGDLLEQAEEKFSEEGRVKGILGLLWPWEK